MFINVQISLQQGEAAPTATPEQIITALGGDPARDTISVAVSSSYSPPVEPPPALAAEPAA